MSYHAPHKGLKCIKVGLYAQNKWKLYVMQPTNVSLVTPTVMRNTNREIKTGMAFNPAAYRGILQKVFQLNCKKCNTEKTRPESIQSKSI